MARPTFRKARTFVGSMVVAASFLAPSVMLAPAASADPLVDNPNSSTGAVSAVGSYVTDYTVREDQWLIVDVYSPSMDREIPVSVWRPADTSAPRPTLYLLNGAGGGEDGATWHARTDAKEFFSDKNVNVVTPLQGKWSYYTDWINDDPVLGRNKWQTFLTQELPPVMNGFLGTNGVNSIAGISSSGTSVFNLALHAPGLYQGIAAYSGCAQASDPIGRDFIKTTVEVWGGGDVLNMWGPDNSPLWAENDPLVRAEELRGYDLYISSGSGLPGPHDTPSGPDLNGDVASTANQIIVGGVIEGATNYCSHNLQRRLDELGIPATYDFPPGGTHSWGYWQDQLKLSWPVLAGSLGV